MTTSSAALERLVKVARAVVASSTEEACDRLLERIRAEPEAEALKAALLEAGVAAIVKEATAR